MLKTAFEMHLIAKFHLESRLPPGAGGAEFPSFCHPKNFLKPALVDASRSCCGAGDASMVVSRTVVYSVRMKR